MRKPIIQLPILLTALLGVAMTIFFVKESQKKRELRLVLPRTDVPLLLDINERLTKVNLPSLRYVVESNIDMTYRTYSYGNPWYDNPPWYKSCNEARQMILIGKIIGEEFGLERFDLSEVQFQ